MGKPTVGEIAPQKGNIRIKKEQTKLSELEKNSPESIYKLIFTVHKGKETVNNEQ